MGIPDRHPRTALRFSCGLPCGVVLGVWCLAAGAAVAEAVSEGDLVRVRMESSAPGAGPSARDAAVRDAENAVLLQVLEAVVGRESAPKVSAVLEVPDKYIQATRILKCDQSADSTTVEIETFVRKKALQIDVARLLARQIAWSPSILVLVAERIGKEAQPSLAPEGVAHTAFCQMLRDAHMEVADDAALRKRYTQAELLERVQGNIEVIRQFAQEHLVDVVLLGDAACETEPVSTGLAVHRNTATVTVRLLRARDGKMLDAITQDAVVHSADPAEGGSQAIQDACAKLRQDVMVTALLAAISAEASDDVLLTVTSHGARARFDEILHVIAQHPGVKSVEELFYSDAEARVRIRYDGRMAPLVDDLTLRAYSDFSVEAEQVVERNILLSVAEAGSSANSK